MEAEHLIPKNGLTPDNYAFLANLEFDPEMRGNRMALFSDPTTVERIQNAAQGGKEMLADALWGGAVMTAQIGLRVSSALKTSFWMMPGDHGMEPIILSPSKNSVTEHGEL